MRLVPLTVGGLLFALATTGGICGGSSTKSAAEKLAEWVSVWRGDAARGTHRPPTFEVPRPPEVALAAAGTQLADEVARARPPLANLRARVYNQTTQEATEYTQGAMCEWFSWYVEDPTQRPVPRSDQFVFLFASGALKVKLATPVEKKIKDAAELFRNAIKRGQDLTEDARNAAMAAACSVPLGG